MIWHIFKKDWKLLWWQAGAVVALATGAGLADAQRGYFGSTDPPRTETALIILAFLAGLFLITELVQQDPIPGGAQDWLVRPVKRADLLLAKLLFVLLALEAPILIVAVMTDFARGFPLGTTLSGVTVEMLAMTLSLGLPALAFASLFRGITETIAAAFAVVLALMAGGFLIMGRANFPLVGPTNQTGVHWVADVAENSVYFLGAAAVLAMQYYRRQTVRARWVAAAFFALARLTPMMPWQSAFALQQGLAPSPGSASSVVLAFDSSPNRTRLAFCIPVTVSGLPADSWVNVDRVSVSLTDAAGGVVWKNPIQLPWIDSAKPFSSIRGHDGCEPFSMDSDEINRLSKMSALHARLDYSLTLFGLDKSYAIPVGSSSDGDQVLPDVGRCGTRTGYWVTLRCITQKAPTCAMAFLSNKTTGLRTPPAYSCNPDYEPFGGETSTTWGSGLSIPSRNLPDPVITNWQFVLRTYKPLDHFTRQLTTPAIDLRDWVSGL